MSITGFLRNLKSEKNNFQIPQDLEKALIVDEANKVKLLENLSFVHKDIQSRQEAEAKIKLHKTFLSDGGFLIRYSTACDNDYILSFIHNSQFLHFQIIFNVFTRTFSLNKYDNIDKKEFQGLDTFIEYYKKNGFQNICKLKNMCPGGSIPHPLAITVGYSNLLHKSISSGHEEFALFILSHPNCLPVDDRNNEGNTALHLACIFGLKFVVSKLISKKATIDATNLQGYTPLQLSCQYNWAKIVEILLQWGANPQNRHKENGNVALHFAADKGHLEVVETLLKNDIPFCPRNLNLITPYELAKKNNHCLITDLLDSYKPSLAMTAKSDWFHDNIANREEANKILMKYINDEGYFFVRHSSKEVGKLVLNVTFQKEILYFPIDYCMGMYFIENGPLFPSLEHLIQYYCLHPDGIPDVLTVAISADEILTPMSTIGKRVFSHEKTKQLLQMSSPPNPKEPMVLNKDNITLGDELGYGEFGCVMRGVWKAPNNKLIDVAVKTLHEEHLLSGKDNFLSEAKVMVQLNHPSIVKLIGVCSGPPLMLVQELLPLGSLLDYLLDYPHKINIKVDIPLWAGQVVDGMAYLEKLGFVHRDLAARNILLATQKIVKICDFGLSRAIGSNDYYRASKGGKWPLKWYAPESINYGTFSSASDVWSFGVTLWEMYTLGEQPYEGKTSSEVLVFLERCGRLIPPSCCPAATNTLMRSCWCYNAEERPKFSEIYKHYYPAKSKFSLKKK